MSPPPMEQLANNIDHLVSEAIVKQGIQSAVAACDFSVTVADPRLWDCPLIAVSREFERMTGFSKEECLGANCRFLNKDCDLNSTDMMSLRITCETGAPFAAVVTNRKKSGELFRNLLDVRGLSVAEEGRTGEDLWFLVGVQADVTSVVDAPTDHLTEMQSIADAIRTAIVKELSSFAVAGACKAALAGVGPPCPESHQLLKEPRWKLALPVPDKLPQVLDDRVLLAVPAAAPVMSKLLVPVADQALPAKPPVAELEVRRAAPSMEVEQASKTNRQLAFVTAGSLAVVWFGLLFGRTFAKKLRSVPFP